MTSRKIGAFRRTVWKHYRTQGRHTLPWRTTRDPYCILVSEVMLQQTQVSRVIEKYSAFVQEFPSIESLAQSPLSQVIKAWSGLGYNRRGKYLHESARVVVREHSGDIRRALLHKLPGVGEYTRAAVRTFAFNEPHAMLETNIRAVFIHHFFPDTSMVNDRELLIYIEKASEDQDPRTWYWALMDYGAHLKKIHQNPTRKSRAYTKQTPFRGSLREVRGATLKILSDGPTSNARILATLGFESDRVRAALDALTHEGLIVKKRNSWTLVD
jgi:A/G-specific adenine glycosylase